MPKKKSSDDSEQLNAWEIVLNQFYKEAKEERRLLYPDDAMKKLSDWMNKANEVQKVDISALRLKNPRIDIPAELRKIHHYAVDLYYETYYGKRDGAPRIDNHYLEYIVTLRAKGLSYGKIAKELNYPISPPSELRKSTDKIRKQLDTAKERGIKPSS